MFRLFIVRRENHCSGGEGASTVDWLGYLERWTEHAVPPDVIIRSHVKIADLNLSDEHGRTELDLNSQFPVDPAHPTDLPYPIEAKYLGRGDPNLPASALYNSHPHEPQRTDAARTCGPLSGIVTC